MKSSVAIAMIVCGTILVLMPYVHNTLAMQQLTETMIALNKPVNLTGDLPKFGDTICIIGGIFMILVGAIAGLKEDKNE